MCVFDVRLRGRIININSDHCFHCGDDGNSCKALWECIVVAVNPQMDKLLFAQSLPQSYHVAVGLHFLLKHLKRDSLRPTPAF